jgi:hypothetical protein
VSEQEQPQQQDNEICTGCGQLQGIPAYDEKLWDIYNRIDDGRSTHEALVFDSEWLQENVQDEEDHAVVMHSMEKDMYNRGLCVKCGRPNLQGVDSSQILSTQDAIAMAEMWAEQAAERRAGA